MLQGGSPRRLRTWLLESVRDALTWLVSGFLLRYFPAVANKIYETLSFRFRSFLVNHGVFSNPSNSFAWSLSLRNGKKLMLTVAPSNHFWTDYAFGYLIHDPSLKRLQEYLLDDFGIDSLYIDVGANIGTSSVYALASGCNVWMFEPNADASLFFEELWQLNGFKPCKIERVALSDRVGEATFYISRSSYLSSFVEKNAEREGIVNTVVVPLRTLDSYMLELEKSYRRIVLKIDVEGHEFAVLKGARCVLQRFRPVVMIEVLQERAGRSDVFGFLTEIAYACYGIDDTVDLLQVEQLLDVSSVIKYHGINFVFIPLEEDSKFLVDRK